MSKRNFLSPKSTGPDPVLERLAYQESRWIKARYDSHCVACKCSISAGDRVLYFPETDTNAKSAVACEEFGDLILIQRGFQASSQIVSVSNDMIQQLFGIRGQGG